MKNEEPESVSAGFSLRERLSGGAPVLQALVVSLLAHGLFIAVVYLQTGFRPPLRVEFDVSRGVALMSQIGNSARIEEREEATLAPAPETPDVTEHADAPDPDDVSVITAERERTREAREQAEQDEQDRVQSQRAEQEARQRRRERRRVEEQRRAEAEAQAAAEVEAEPAEDDSDAVAAPVVEADSGVPPAERYPPGTLNPVATDVGMWGPEGAQIVVILRNDRLRRSPHEDSVRRVLSSFPDWKSLLGGADLDPIDDVDTLLIASSDPRYVNRTFLAAVHTIPPSAVTRVLSEGFNGAVVWTERDGRLIGEPDWGPSIVDPRVFVIPTENVFIFSRPEFIAPLLSDAPAPVGLDIARDEVLGRNGSPGSDDEDASGNTDGEPTPAAASGAADGDGDSSALSAVKPSSVVADDRPPVRDDGWLRGILNLADFGGAGADGPAVIVSTGAIRSLSIRGMGNATEPQSLSAAITASADPVVRARFVFRDREEADRFRRAWPEIIDANRTALSLTGLSGPLSEAGVRTDHNEVIAEFVIPGRVLRRMAVTIERLMNAR